MAKMKAPEGCTGCSFNGEEFEVDKDGNVDVPEEAVAELSSHGFVTDPTANSAPKPAKKK